MNASESQQSISNVATNDDLCFIAKRSNHPRGRSHPSIIPHRRRVPPPGLLNLSLASFVTSGHWKPVPQFNFVKCTFGLPSHPQPRAHEYPAPHLDTYLEQPLVMHISQTANKSIAQPLPPDS
jgi:hypothetical protein